MKIFELYTVIHITWFISICYCSSYSPFTATGYRAWYASEQSHTAKCNTTFTAMDTDYSANIIMGGQTYIDSTNTNACRDQPVAFLMKVKNQNSAWSETTSPSNLWDWNINFGSSTPTRTGYKVFNDESFYNITAVRFLDIQSSSDNYKDSTYGFAFWQWMWWQDGTTT